MRPRAQQQRGLALVVTLIMLAVVTVMAVIFLAVSRSQKASVTVVQDQSDARYMADSAVARAQADILGRVMSATNPYNVDFFVSTNFIDLIGYQHGLNNRTNVAYTYRRSGAPLTRDDLRLMLSSLQYDPRPPVFVKTNDAGREDFRFYLDLNRNGRFETNGVIPVLDRNGRGFTIGPDTFLSQKFVGDPEWIGVLQKPDQPHSPSNRFIGRYAFLVQPAGRVLDLNHIHNSAKGDAGFFRNQGVGSWELNLAALLSEVNTNYWATRQVGGPGVYNYNTNSILPNQGFAFQHASDILSYRYGGNSLNLLSIQSSLGNNAAAAFVTDGIDEHADGPLMVGRELPGFDRDNVLRSWAGSDNVRKFFDPQELFDANKVGTGIPTFLRDMGQRISTYDRYSYYRLLGSLGTDTPSEVEAPNRLELGKGHINYALNRFPPFGLFTTSPTNALPVEAMRADVLKNLTVAVPTANGVRAFFAGVEMHTNILRSGEVLLYPTNQNHPEVHRLGQLLANVTEAVTNGIGITTDTPPPTVYQPVLNRTASGEIFLNGYQRVQDANVLFNRWLDLRQPAERGIVPIRPNEGTPLNVHGVPWIVGARKGLPNFNEFSMQTLVQVTRKLQVAKRNINGGPAPGNLVTNQMNLISVSNIFGIEAWNPYNRAYPRALRMVARVETDYSLQTTNSIVWPVTGGYLKTTNFADRRFAPNTWGAGQFIVPLFTNQVIIPQSIVLFSPVTQLRDARLAAVFDGTPGFPVLDVSLRMTNRVQYFLIDEGIVPNRIIDVVTLDGLVSGLNLTTNLMGSGSIQDRSYVDGGGGGGSLSDSAFWNTNRLGSPISPTVGISNQLYVSLNRVLSEADWRDFSGDPRSGQDVLKAIEGFRRFMGLVNLGSSRLDRDLSPAHEVPFTPTRRFFQETRWQANDPIVHYTPTDLFSPNLTYNGFLKPSQRAWTNTNLGKLNDRYSPWGGNTNKSEQIGRGNGFLPNTDYNMAIKDPLVYSPNDWIFPTNKFPNIGWLGRVHRGTPWQTVYLKSYVEPPRAWVQWAGTPLTHPTNDWKYLELFTTAPNANATRGRLSVNQTNTPAWAAALGGVVVLSNNVAVADARPGVRPNYLPYVIEPGSPQLRAIVDSIAQARAQRPGGVFTNLGDVLSAPGLSVGSPYINTNGVLGSLTLTDDVVERIPQQILSLLKLDEPVYVIYAYGQSLKPAANSLLLSPGPFFQLCTNYQITGETAVKAVLRLDGAPFQPRAVIQSYNSLDPN